MAELSWIETVVVLESVDFFSSCSAEQIFRISAIARQRAFQAGVRICRANDPAVAIYCVVSGGIRLEDPQGGSRVIGPLETFGVMEILSGRLHVRDARAAADTVLLVIDAEDFFNLLASNIEIVKALFRGLLEDRKRTGI